MSTCTARTTVVHRTLYAHTRTLQVRYLQNVAAELEEAGGSGEKKAAVAGQHPRLKELLSLYGQVLVTMSKAAAAGGNIGASAVELRLTCVAASAGQKMGTQVKKVPRSTAMSALKLLCEKLFKVKANQQALFIARPGEPMPEEIGEHVCTQSVRMGRVRLSVLAWRC